MLKNYALKLMNREEQIGLTAEQAAQIIRHLQSGTSKCVIVGGSAYATHQIVSVERVDDQTEKDLCELKNIPPESVKTIEDYLHKPLKQITNGSNR